jgi:hypothetical protein
MVDSASMVGWITVREITDFLAATSNSARCEKLVFSVSTPNRKVLKHLAWKLADEGYRLVVQTDGQVIAERGRITINIEAREE